MIGSKHMPKLLTPIIVAIMGITYLSINSVVFAQIDCNNPANTKEAIQCGSSNVSGVPVTSAPETAVQGLITDSVNILTFVVGAIAVIMMIYAGFLFVTSAGDANKIATAKKAVLYAVIGVAIIAIAQIFSQFIATKIFQFP